MKFFCVGLTKERQELYSQLFTCNIGDLPMRYFGVPIDKIRILKKDWKTAENKMEHKLGCWQGRFQSIGGRLILINSSLSNVPLYMLSFYMIPKGVRERIDFFRRRFFFGKKTKALENTTWSSGQLFVLLGAWGVGSGPYEQSFVGEMDLEAGK